MELSPSPRLPPSRWRPPRGGQARAPWPAPGRSAELQRRLRCPRRHKPKVPAAPAALALAATAPAAASPGKSAAPTGTSSPEALPDTTAGGPQATGGGDDAALCEAGGKATTPDRKAPCSGGTEFEAKRPDAHADVEVGEQQKKATLGTVKGKAPSANPSERKGQVMSDKTSTKPSEDVAEVEGATRVRNPPRGRRLWWLRGLIADEETATAPHVTSGEDQTKLPDTDKVTSAGGSANLGTGELQVKSATESAKPSEDAAKVKSATRVQSPWWGRRELWPWNLTADADTTLYCGEDGVAAGGFLVGPDGAPMRRRNGFHDLLLDRLKRASVPEAVVTPNLGPPDPPLLVSSPVLPGASPGSASSRRPLLRETLLAAGDSETSGVDEVSAASVVESRPKAPGKSKTVRFAVEDSEASGVAGVSAASVVRSRPEASGKPKPARFAARARAAQLAADAAEYSQQQAEAKAEKRAADAADQALRSAAAATAGSAEQIARDEAVGPRVAAVASSKAPRCPRRAVGSKVVIAAQKRATAAQQAATRLARNQKRRAKRKSKNMVASGPTPGETLLVAPGSVTAAADSSLASPLVSCLLTAAGPSVVSSGDLGSLATAGFSFPTAPHANSGEDQTKVSDTVRVKSAGGSARMGTDEAPVRGARASASPSKGVAGARCAAGGARPGKRKGHVKSTEENSTMGEFRFQYYRNPSRGFYNPVNTKRWSCSYDRYTAKKKKRRGAPQGAP